jgi:hypothetical protein
MDAARTRGCETHAEFAGVLRVGARGEGGRLFMAHLDESNFVLANAKSFDDTVHAIARKSEDRVDTPFHQYFN